jgi:hypothetical protein
LGEAAYTRYGTQLARRGISLPLNGAMRNERPQPEKSKEKTPAPNRREQERSGRSGEGARSVLPYLKADMRARAVAKIGKRAEREF